MDQKLLLIFILIMNIFYSYAANAAQTASFNFKTIQFDKLETIPNMAQVSKLITAGIYTYAFADTKIPINFAYRDDKWHAASQITHEYDQIAFDQESSKPRAWILDSKSHYQAFFNGNAWIDITTNINPQTKIVADGEKAWLVEYSDNETNSPVKVSQFDFNNTKWMQAEILADHLDRLNQVTTANGNLYLVGMKNKQAVLMIHDGSTWRDINYLPIEQADKIDVLVDKSDIVLITKTNNREMLIFSTNQGKTWHEYAFNTTFESYRHVLLNGSYYRFGIVKGSIYYSLHYLNLYQQPFVMNVAEEHGNVKDYRYFPYPKEASIDAKLFCFSRMVYSNGAFFPYAGCFDFETKAWRTWYATQFGTPNYIDVLNDVRVLSNNNMVLIGGLRGRFTPAAFIYDGNKFTEQTLDGLSFKKLSQDTTDGADMKIHLANKTIVAY